ncbi:CotH kinase family protein [Candidatus Nephthysia bennettiae]|uniref:CotH kinase family protein n=1 Tax=Candidatus Nephthysia bennettiae TaxID=3127016 RepID=A0A934N8M7_9BACT|nr:CotH kinase family protein [Candidatus Dormibacteraeota bacterium]MBJ7614337.1 CotH kinase family protein [Candidatus Dormibacteraeota bacterium]
MGKSLDRGEFWDLFKDRMVVLADVAPGRSRELAQEANEAGRQDASLRTRAEFAALFDLLNGEALSEPGHAQLTLVDEAGHPTPAGQAIQDYLAAAHGKEDFFDQSMYMVHVTGWPEDRLQPEQPVQSSGEAQLAAWKTDPADGRHIAPPGEGGMLFASPTFSLMNSGNRTLRAPRRSWKVNFQIADGADRLAGMERINLKSMFNDASQMRESIAWRLFEKAGVPASRHTYAKLGINATYIGLFSLVEQVDRRFLRDHFGKNDRGNLYKVYCGDIGCGTLEHRIGEGGDDSGRQYFRTGSEDQTYRLKSNDASAATYDDLAALVRAINGVGLPGGDRRFESDAFRDSVEALLNVRCILRWAGANLLLGSWDNYFATPANYYLYNSGLKKAAKQFVDSPYFTLVPWDYDNCLGIDYFQTEWQYTDLLDWPSATEKYCKQVRYPGRVSPTPLVQNLLRQEAFRQYYLDHLEHLLDTEFNPDSMATLVGPEGGPGLWDRVSHAAYLESHAPHEQPFTGRQFTNDEVYLGGFKQQTLHHGEAQIEGILDFVRMRHDSARRQLAGLRRTDPAGASGAGFPGVMESLPARE